MTADPVRAPLKQRPFQPFTLRLVDGGGVRVESSEWAIASPTGHNMIVFQRDNAFHIIDIMLIADLEVGPPPASTSPVP